MKIYLAARFGRQDELRGYRSQLLRAGHSVTSRWLDVSNAEVEDPNDTSVRAVVMRNSLATVDLEDIDRADTLIAFTEPPDSDAARGGRHVELGYALAQGKQIAIVGHRENLFCWIIGLRFYSTWTECLHALGTTPAYASSTVAP